MKKLIRKIVNLLGYEIVKKTNGRDSFEYDFEHNAKEAIAVILQNTMVSFEPLITLYQQVRHCELNNIIGDFVECGVWKGGGCRTYGIGKHEI